MSKNSTIHLGIVGACGRGSSFKAACNALPQVCIHAVCDVDAGGLPAAAERLGATDQYTDYDDMLERSTLDAVILATPMPFHAPQAVAALQQNLHVFSEVPAAVSVEECRALTLAANASDGIYMMGENYTYWKENVLIRELVRQGLFGETYYAEGEYLHELKEYDERRLGARGINSDQVWRRHWQNGIDGITYGTHGLGPILQWMPKDREVFVCCQGSGHHYLAPDGKPYAQDTSVMLCNMQKRRSGKIRVDMISNRPHAMTNYLLQGTTGCYESACAREDKSRIWLRDAGGDAVEWTNLSALEEAYLPSWWQASDAVKAGHGGGDYFELLDFVAAIEGRKPPTIGVHDALGMTLPGLISQQSIAEGGETLEVPDSRKW
jgi:predicted dehydrogenase